MLRTPKAMKILLRRDDYSAKPRWQNYSHPRYRGIVGSWTARSITDLRSAELLDGVVELLNAGAEYYTSVQTIIPLAASSEVIFTWFYNTFVRRAGDPAAQTFLLGFDSEPIRAEKSLYDLAAAAKTEPALAAALTALSSADLVELVRGSEPPTGVASTAWEQWRTAFLAHLDRYGHAVYNLDFMNAVPADEPGPLLGTIRFFLSDQGANPYERQQRTAARRDEQTATVLARLDPARRAAFSRLLHWAQESLRCVRMRWLMWDWPGHGCGGCWANSVDGWLPPVRSRRPRTCTGCGTTNSALSRSPSTRADPSSGSR